MRAVWINRPGEADVLTVMELPDPVAKPGEVVIKVAASAVNRADILQRLGYYQPPPGAPEVLGLECSGVIESVGDDVDDWQVGDEVCALLSGGGYAERVAVPAGHLLPVPQGVALVEAAGLPEVACTVWSNVFMLAALQPGELLLVHGGSSGVGTMAIQLAKALGARVACTVGSPAKADHCMRLGADLAVRYRDQDFVEEVRRFEPAGADVILDNMGAKYLSRNVDALAVEGRLVVIGLQGGSTGELDLGALLRKRAAVLATLLRARPGDEKAAIVASVVEHVWPLLADGVVRPIVDSRFPLDDVAEAHRRVEASEHVGKVLLTV